MKHRADIQGLRALCVIAVCIYHAFPWLLPGGFIGVDVFFVISGFLITRILVEELNNTGHIDPIKFWAKRAQRLLPNALLTLMFVLMASAILLPGYRQAAITKDLISAASFFSNLRFASQAVDYFESNDVVSPVLHFWSLSLEEQFYFLLPITLLGISLCTPKRLTRFVAPILLLIVSVASFTYGLYEVKHAASVAFFSFLPRVWELALGGLFGIYIERVRAITPTLLHPMLAMVGTLSVIACAVIYTTETPFPGAHALIPILGATLILCFAPETWIGRIISVSPLQWIGDRSYSIYLWHWPFLAISMERWPESNISRWVAIAGFIAAACAVYPLEDRIRKLPFHSHSFQRMGLATASIALFCGVCFLVLHHPQEERSAARSAEINRASKDFGRNIADRCHLQVDDATQPPCVYGDLASSRVLYLFGDSHAAMWFSPVVKAANNLGWKVVVRTRSGCPAAIVSIWIPWLKAYYKNCDSWRVSVIDEIREVKPRLVIISEFGNYYHWLYDRSTLAILSPSDSRTAWNKGVSDLIAALPQASHVIVLRDTPTQLKSYKDCLSHTDICGRERNAALSQMPPINPFQIGWNVQLIDLTDRICDESWCPAIKDGAIIYQDNHHLTATFAATLSTDFERYISDVAKAPQMSVGSAPLETTNTR